MPDEAQQEGAERTASVLMELSNAMVRLHKEQFGRGPTAVRSAWAGENTIVVTFREALLPAERALVELGQCDRVIEGRLHFQEATRDRFMETATDIIGRDIHAFSSACDPRSEIVWEIFEFEPRSDSR